MSLNVGVSTLPAQNNVTATYEPAAQIATSQGSYAADAADWDSRISNLESQLKKKTG
jgi:hypothetical protein